MLAQTPPENPLLEIARSFNKDSVFHQDITKLTKQVDELINVIEVLELETLMTTLQHRAGGKKKKDEVPESTFGQKAEDFTKGFSKGLMGEFLSSAIVDGFKYVSDKITSKNINPAAVEAAKELPEEQNTETVSEDKLDRKNKSEPTIRATPNTTEQNKILSDMVEVLIDMRDDRSQKKLLEEAAEIKKVLLDQNKKTELPGGIEPNTEEAKDLDRQKLADLIAFKLGEVMSDMGIGGNSGFVVPPVKSPAPAPVPAEAAASAALAAGTVGAVTVGGAAATGLATGILASEQAAPLREAVTENPMLGAMSGDTALAAAILDANKEPDTPKVKEEKIVEKFNPTRDEALAALENGSSRDIEKLGGSDFLKKIAGVETKPFEQSSLRKYDYESPEVKPKSSEINIGKILNEVSDKNTELKMFNMSKDQPTTIAPIISNKTINNTEQTMIASSPSPHSNASSLNRWQQKRSTYTD